jgi:hypothetical protein
MKTITINRRLALFIAVIMALTLWTAVPLQAKAEPPEFTLTYSEGGVMLGAENADAMAKPYAKSTATTYTINLTSPVGVATERYFTTSNEVAQSEIDWKLSSGITGASVTVVNNTSNKTYKVSIPAEATGAATLTVGVYTIMFNVSDDVTATNALKPGETFELDGIEWRVLIPGNESLIIAEHVIETRQFHSVENYPLWWNSDIHAYMNSAFLNGRTTLVSKSIYSSVKTMSAAYTGGNGSYGTSTDKIFLLSIEEVYYTGQDNVSVSGKATVSTMENRTNGNTVIFADDHARKATSLPNLLGYSNYWLLRSPTCLSLTNRVSVVSSEHGLLPDSGVITQNGFRPALRLDLTSPLPKSRKLTVTGGSGGGWYMSGADVPISANDALTGQEFSNWTSSKSGIFNPSFSAASAVFTVLATGAVTVTAHYRWNTPSIAINYADETLTGFVEGAKYKFNSDLKTISGTTYPINGGWMTGDDLAIVREEAGSVLDSNPKNLAIPERSNTPGAPTVSGTPSATSITLNTIPGAQYAIKTISSTEQNELSWQALPTFNDLITNTSYTFVAQITATEAAFASLPSEASETITTAKATQSALLITGLNPTYSYGQAPFDIGTSGGSGDGSVTYSISEGTGVASVSGNTVTILGAGTFKITATKAEDNTYKETSTQSGNITVNPPPAPQTYLATVNNGTGGGSFAAGDMVSITANAPADGKVFDTWTSSGITLADPTSATTSFTMPANAVTVTATYKDDVPDVTDTDGDGVPDDVEGEDGTDPNDPGDFKDTDDDGVPDYIETKDGTDPTDKNSFKDENSDGIPDYVQEHQEPLNEINGWVYANGAWKYYVDSVAKTGWLYDTNYKAWFYFDKATEIMKTGWIYDQNIWYYLAGNGAMKTGWVKDDGSWYYLRGNGAMVWSKWLKDTDGSWYYLSGNGKMLTGKRSIDGKAYSFKANGVWTS